MSTRLSAEELDAIEKRANEAIEGPWYAESDGIYDRYRSYLVLPVGNSDQDRADAAFITAARSDVPSLVAEVRAARAESERLRAELEEVKQDRSEVYREAASAMNEHNERALTLGIAERESVRLREALRGLVDAISEEDPESGWSESLAAAHSDARRELQ